MRAKWFLCTQSLWKNDTERSFFAVLLSVVFLCLKVIIKLNFRHIAIGWVTPHRWKDPLPATLPRSMISAVSLLVCAVRFLFVPWSFCLCRGVFVCAVIVFVCAVTVFVCAVKFLFVPWQFLFVPWSFCMCRGTRGPPYSTDPLMQVQLLKYSLSVTDSYSRCPSCYYRQYDTYCFSCLPFCHKNIALIIFSFFLTIWLVISTP